LTKQEVIQEQITRVLLERLIVNRPHPWGLLITFIELIKVFSLYFGTYYRLLTKLLLLSNFFLSYCRILGITSGTGVSSDVPRRSKSFLNLCQDLVEVQNRWMITWCLVGS